MANASCAETGCPSLVLQTPSLKGVEDAGGRQHDPDQIGLAGYAELAHGGANVPAHRGLGSMCGRCDGCRGAAGGKRSGHPALCRSETERSGHPAPG